jgi:hypothetical protein
MFRRFLKAIAVIMIFLPEPVTTAVGLALLTVVMAIPSHKHLSSFKNLDELAKRSLKNSSSLEYSHNISANRANIQISDWFDNRRISETIFHHTLKTSLPQYEAPVASQITDLRWTEEDRPCVQMHTLKLDLASATAIPVNMAESEPDWLDTSNVVHHILKQKLF